MPIYEYRCTACGQEMDHFHRSRSEPKPVCKTCNEDALERLVSLTSFQLKGEGWYVTDYAKKAEKTPAASRDTASASSGDTTTSAAAADTSAAAPDTSSQAQEGSAKQGNGTPASAPASASSAQPDNKSAA